MNIDLLLIENGSGGELVLENGDLKTIQGLQNFIYLALFGGNVEGSTKEIIGTEQRFYWWANDALLDELQEQQMNSETEKLLNKIVMNSQGRLKLIEAVKEDLEFMSAFGDVAVNVIFEGVDRVNIDVTIQQLSNEADVKFTFIWDATKRELLQKNYYLTL